jgi:hypothetical protein
MPDALATHRHQPPHRAARLQRERESSIRTDEFVQPLVLKKKIQKKGSAL